MDSHDFDSETHPEPSDPPVPEILRSNYTGLPFRTCLVCDEELALAELHVVEKVVRNNETVLEMALCAGCCSDMARDCSEESLETLRTVQEDWVMNADPEGELCAGCAKPRGHDDSFVLAGYFLFGYELERQIAVCEKCHEEVQEKLSKRTRDSFGDFVENHFPGVPENIDSPVFFP